MMMVGSQKLVQTKNGIVGDLEGESRFLNGARQHVVPPSHFCALGCAFDATRPQHPQPHSYRSLRHQHTNHLAHSIAPWPTRSRCSGLTSLLSDPGPR